MVMWMNKERGGNKQKERTTENGKAGEREEKYNRGDGEEKDKGKLEDKVTEKKGRVALAPN